jgi:hypothetical protein
MKKLDTKVLFLTALALIILLGGGYFLLFSNNKEESEITESNTQSINEETSAREETQESESDNALVGSYEGTYTINDGVDNLPAWFTISSDMSIRGTGELINGKEFSIQGTVNADGSFSAEGTVDGTDTEVTFEGSFVEKNDTVIASGTFDAGFDGTWEATKK